MIFKKLICHLAVFKSLKGCHCIRESELLGTLMPDLLKMDTPTYYEQMFGKSQSPVKLCRHPPPLRLCSGFKRKLVPILRKQFFLKGWDPKKPIPATKQIRIMNKKRTDPICFYLDYINCRKQKGYVRECIERLHSKIKIYSTEGINFEHKPLFFFRKQ